MRTSRLVRGTVALGGLIALSFLMGGCSIYEYHGGGRGHHHHRRHHHHHRRHCEAPPAIAPLAPEATRTFIDSVDT